MLLSYNNTMTQQNSRFSTSFITVKPTSSSFTTNIVTRTTITSLKNTCSLVPSSTESVAQCATKHKSLMSIDLVWPFIVGAITVLACFYFCQLFKSPRKKVTENPSVDDLVRKKIEGYNLQQVIDVVKIDGKLRKTNASDSAKKQSSHYSRFIEVYY